MDLNKVSAVSALGCLVLAAATFAIQIWPVPQMKAEHAQVVVSPITGMAPNVKDNRPTTIGGPKLIAAFMIAGFMLAGISIYGAWRRPKPKLVIRSAMYGIGAFNDVSVLGKLNATVKEALVIPVDNNLADGHDPAPNQAKRLRVEYSYGNSAKRVAEKPESQPGQPSVLVLPEDSGFQGPNGNTDWKTLYLRDNLERTNLQKEHARVTNRVTELERQLSEAIKPDTSLRGRTIAKCDELKEFLREYGPKADTTQEPGESQDDHIRRTTALYEWKGKMGADFRLRFGASVRQIRDELQVRSGWAEQPLDDAIALAESRLCEPKAVEEIRKHFWNSLLWENIA